MRRNGKVVVAGLSLGVLALTGCQNGEPSPGPTAMDKQPSSATSTPSTSGSAQSGTTAPGPSVSDSPAPKTADPSPSTNQGSKAATGTALAALATLEVKGRAPMTGYSRKLFPHWLNVGDGCAADDAAVKRFANVELAGKCREVAASLLDPYSNKTIKWGTKRSKIVDIDHVVALGDAWQKGAQSWTTEKRAALANDQLNLLPVDASLNRQKGQADAATWLPPNTSYRPAYVARQIAVKKRYGLWVTQAEKDAMSEVLKKSPNEPLPTSRIVTVDKSVLGKAATQTYTPKQSKTSPSPVDIAKPVPAGPGKRYPNCTAAKAAGEGPFVKGKDPQYEFYSDRDGDGTVCE